MASKASLENGLRNGCLDLLKEFFAKHYECDILPVSASEIALPVQDAEGNDKFILIKVSIPRGTRNGEGGYDPYDGYAIAEDYRIEQETKAQERAEKEAAKAAREAKKKAKENEEEDE